MLRLTERQPDRGNRRRRSTAEEGAESVERVRLKAREERVHSGSSVTATYRSVFRYARAASRTTGAVSWS